MRLERDLVAEGDRLRPRIDMVRPRFETTIARFGYILQVIAVATLSLSSRMMTLLTVCPPPGTVSRVFFSLVSSQEASIPTARPIYAMKQSARLPRNLAHILD